MRIAMVQGRADPGQDGVADYTRLLCGALEEAGEEVVPVPFVGLRATAARLRTLRPDVTHVQFAPSAYRFSARPGLLADLVGSPLVTTLHEYGWWARPAWVPDAVWRPWERVGLWDRETGRLAPRSRALLVTNPGHARVVADRLGRTAVRVPLAPNVPDLTGGATDRVATRSRLAIPADAQVVAFFGFVHPVKGLRYLIEALARLRSAGRDRLHLLVLGGFTSLALPEPEARAFREELTAWTRTCGVERHVTITGHLPAVDVSAGLHAADVAAFPMTAGATTKSGALLSAFAHGLPTLVTAADPPDPDLVDGGSVVVAPRVRDATVLVDGLARVLDDEALRRKVTAGGAALMTGRSWQEIAATHRAVYAEVSGSG